MKISRNVTLKFDNTIRDFKESEVDLLSSQNQTELSNLLILNDLATNPENDLSVIPASSHDGTCDYIVLVAYPTKSRSIHKLEAAVNTFTEDNPGCTKVGSGDSGCLFGDYGCVASQGFECTGDICDWF